MLINTKIIIDGVDITPWIAHGGVKWTRSDIDGPNAGRTMSGLMVRDRVATKIRLDITCHILELTDLRVLLNAIHPEFVSVTYDDPMQGTVTKTMYSNNNSAQFLLPRDGGKELWDSITFPLIEQ